MKQRTNQQPKSQISGTHQKREAKIIIIITTKIKVA